MMNQMNNVSQVQQINRGDIYMVNLPITGNSIQGGLRPIIICSNSIACKHSPVLQYIPLTSRAKKWMPTHVDVEVSVETGLRVKSIAMCEQINLVSTGDLLEKVGICSSHIISKLDKGISIQLGLVDATSNVAYA
ncbi:MAG TPA: type II toxin-antitoxin system PemK/MazF family toxin [Clostridium sp.]